MKKFIILFAMWIIVVPGFSQKLKFPCAVDRWPVKTLTDKDTTKINFKNIIKTSISAQIKLKPPTNVTQSLPRQFL